MAANPLPRVSELSFDVAVAGDETTVRCSGRIVAETVHSLKSAVKPLLGPGNIVVLDLTDVNYMDSSGLGTIVSLYVSARSSKSELRLMNLSPRVRELLSITRLGQVMAEGRDPHDFGIP